MRERVRIKAVPARLIPYSESESTVSAVHLAERSTSVLDDISPTQRLETAAFKKWD